MAWNDLTFAIADKMDPYWKKMYQFDEPFKHTSMDIEISIRAFKESLPSALQSMVNTQVQNLGF